MRSFLIVATLFLAGCASRAPQPVQPASSPQPVSREGRQLLGLTPNEVAARFGAPALQVREGTSLKLQFRGRSCVLDAYFYPSNGALRTTHIDTRTLSGSSADQAACVFALENGS
jgi:hypothetical protein